MQYYPEWEHDKAGSVRPDRPTACGLGDTAKAECLTDRNSRERCCMWHLLAVFALALLCLTANIRPAYSQFSSQDLSDLESPLENESVLGRSRPEYDAIGLPLGAFRAYPTVSLNAAYDSNVLRTDSNAQHDYIISMTPGVILRSEWVRHYLAARASATRYRYSRLSSENRTEWNAAVAGRLDILTGFNLTGAASYEATFENRESRDQIQVGAAKPTPYSTTRTRAALSYNPFRLGVQVGFEHQRDDYGNTVLASSGGERNNDDRDRNDYSVYTTAVYEFSPGYGVFVRPSYQKRVYDLDTGRAAGRDAEGYRIDGGLNFLVTRLITGEAYLGYIKYDVERPDFSDLSGVNFGARLLWYPSELITVHLNASRTPNATTIDGASVGDDHYVEAGADYEVLRNVILQGSLAYRDSRFPGITRRDNDFGALLGVRYLVNQYLRADLSVTRRTRSSNETNVGFVDHILFLGLRGQI